MRNTPYMSMSERTDVLNDHRRKAITGNSKHQILQATLATVKQGWRRTGGGTTMEQQQRKANSQTVSFFWCGARACGLCAVAYSPRACRKARGVVPATHSGRADQLFAFFPPLSSSPPPTAAPLYQRVLLVSSPELRWVPAACVSDFLVLYTQELQHRGERVAVLCGAGQPRGCHVRVRAV